MSLPRLVIGQKWQCRSPEKYVLIERLHVANSFIGAVMWHTGDPAGMSWYYNNGYEGSTTPVYMVHGPAHTDDLVQLLEERVEIPRDLYPRLKVGQVWLTRGQQTFVKVVEEVTPSEVKVEFKHSATGRVIMDKRCIAKQPYPSGYPIKTNSYSPEDLVNLVYDPAGH